MTTENVLPALEVGDWVRFAHSKKVVIGEVTEVVPAAAEVGPLVKLLPDHKAVGKIEGKRSELSYLVMVDGKTPKVYWPERVEKTERPAASESEEPDAPKEEKTERRKKNTETPKVTEAERKRMGSDAANLLDKVHDLAAMTSTENWGRLFRHINNKIQKAKEGLLEAEKPNDVRKLQAEVRVLREFLDAVGDPVREFGVFVAGSPIFAGKTRASWNENLGQVVLSEVG